MLKGASGWVFWLIRLIFRRISCTVKIYRSSCEFLFGSLFWLNQLITPFRECFALLIFIRPFGCVADPGCLSRISDPRSRIPDLWGSWIPDPGSWISDPGSRIPDLGSLISDPGSRILDLGSQISDLGSWISDPGSQNPDLRSRIKKQKQMRGVKKIVVIPFFVATNFT